MACCFLFPLLVGLLPTVTTICWLNSSPADLTREVGPTFQPFTLGTLFSLT
jgi:hypothetical protein